MVVVAVEIKGRKRKVGEEAIPVRENNSALV